VVFVLAGCRYLLTSFAVAADERVRPRSSAGDDAVTHSAVYIISHISKLSETISSINEVAADQILIQAAPA